MKEVSGVKVSRVKYEINLTRDTQHLTLDT